MSSIFTRSSWSLLLAFSSLIPLATSRSRSHSTPASTTLPMYWYRLPNRQKTQAYCAMLLIRDWGISSSSESSSSPEFVPHDALFEVHNMIHWSVLCITLEIHWLTLCLYSWRHQFGDIGKMLYHWMLPYCVGYQ